MKLPSWAQRLGVVGSIGVLDSDTSDALEATVRRNKDKSNEEILDIAKEDLGGNLEDATDRELLGYIQDIKSIHTVLQAEDEISTGKIKSVSDPLTTWVVPRASRRLGAEPPPQEMFDRMVRALQRTWDAIGSDVLDAKLLELQMEHSDEEHYNPIVTLGGDEVAVIVQEQGLHGYSGDPEAADYFYNLPDQDMDAVLKKAFPPEQEYGR